MCIGYDPFKYADNYTSEIDYQLSLEQEMLEHLLNLQAENPNCSSLSDKINDTLDRIHNLEELLENES